MSECLDDDELASHVAGTAGPATDARIKEHIDECAECRRLFVALVFGPRSQEPTKREGAERPTGFEVGSTVLGKYRIERVLGEGGMGRVVLAHDEALDRLVAIKVIRDDLASDAKARARFEREARAIARLKNEHAVRIYDVGALGPLPFIVMEYVDGIDLGAHVKESGPLSARVAAKYVRAACAALSEAHRAGIVHRDIKPRNLLLAGSTIKVIDFGVAKVSDAAPLTRVGAVVGTAPFMAPEQIGGGAVDARADVWALGATLYFLVSGRPPFEGDSREELTAKILEGPAPRSDDEALDAILARCFAKDPRDRFASADELGAALDRFGAERTTPWWLVAGAAVLGASILVIGLSSKQSVTSAIAPGASTTPVVASIPSATVSTPSSTPPAHSSAPAAKTHCACVETGDAWSLCKPELVETRCECHDSFGSLLFSKPEDVGAHVMPTVSGTDGAPCSGFASVQGKGETTFHAEPATGTLHPCARSCTSKRAFSGRDLEACSGMDEYGRPRTGTLRCE